MKATHHVCHRDIVAGIVALSLLVSGVLPAHRAEARDVPLAEHHLTSALVGVIWAEPADVDGDGHLDVLGAAYTGNGIAWFKNSAGDGSTWAQNNIAKVSNPRSIRAVDMDRDGDLDVLAAIQAAGDIIWWENDAGDGTAWSQRTVNSTFGGVLYAEAADIDGDGDLDVVGAASTDDAITWFENTSGTGMSWTEHTIDGAYDIARMARAADIDGDGDLDVIGTGSGVDHVTWWENTAGDGSAWTAHTIGTDFDGRTLEAADLDGDGDLDVVAAAYSSDEVTWWENASATGDGSTWTAHGISTTVDDGGAAEPRRRLRRRLRPSHTRRSRRDL